MVAKTGHSAVIILLCVCSFAHAQSRFDRFLTPTDSFNAPRFNSFVIGASVGGAGTLTALYQLWYADYPHGTFRFVNDNRDWMGMDKFGHVFSAYYSAVSGIRVMKWAGVEKKKALWYGALPSLLFMTAVEVFDGFSEEWGFSPGDFFANLAGTGLAIGQEALWDEQRLLLKFSFHESAYRSQRPEMLGHSLWESWIKDYNGQTYWISASPGSFGVNGWPQWLCVSAGFSARGMITGDPVRQSAITEFAHLERAPQFFTSLDIDLTKIPVKNRLVRTVFQAINLIKIPMPTIQVSPSQPVRGHWLYF